MFGKFPNRLYPGEVEFNPRRFDLLDLLREAFDRIRGDDADRHPIAFESTLSALEVHTDPEHVEFILMNLLQNAVRYTPAGRAITLRVRRDPAAIVVEVQDNGIGIPPADLPRLSEPFFRGSNIGDRPGTGLGLTVVRQSVGAIGGVLVVRSDGAGSRFTVTIPGARLGLNR